MLWRLRRGWIHELCRAGEDLPLRSGLVHFFTSWMLFVANSLSGSITAVLISDMAKDGVRGSSRY